MNISYIAKKETLSCQNLTTEHLVVDGCLNVAGDLKAKTISGSGIIEASRVYADDIRASSLDAVTVICRRLIAERVETSELVASESAAVSLYLGADRVRTPQLRTCFCDIEEMEVGEVIHLKQKMRSLFRFLLVSSLRAWWMKLITPEDVDVEDADYEPTDGRKHLYQIGAQRSGSDLERRSSEVSELSA